MQQIKRIPTRDMSREEWLEHRRKSIGGSDAAALLGLNSYSSPYALWAEKTGRVIPEDISDNESVRLGNDLEQYVAERFTEATGKRVRRDNHIIINSAYPWAHANVDRVVVGEDAGLECKTTSSFEVLSQCREGKYPDTWYCQIMHYMMITGAQRWYLAVLVFGRGFFHFTIERNEEEIAALAEAERSFWEDYVTTGTEPPVDGTEATQDAIKIIYAESGDAREIDLSGIGIHVSTYMALKDKITELQSDLAEQQAIIMTYMGEAERGSYGNVRVSFKTQRRANFDRKAYEAANGPIGEEYFKTSTQRPFKVTVRKN